MSWIVLAPSDEEITKSLRYPKILERRVKNENPNVDFQNLEILNYSFVESKSSDIELTQYLRPVFSFGPSSKT